jgi:hypothetical protein
LTKGSNLRITVNKRKKRSKSKCKLENKIQLSITHQTKKAKLIRKRNRLSFKAIDRMCLTQLRATT